MCNAGTGAVLTSRGTLEPDACVMDDASLASAAVAVLPPFRHPIDVARAKPSPSARGSWGSSATAAAGVAGIHGNAKRTIFLTAERYWRPSRPLV